MARATRGEDSPGTEVCLGVAPAVTFDFAKLDVVMATHPRFAEAGPAATGYWAACLAYIKHQNLKGIVPWAVIGIPLSVGDALARELGARLIAYGLFAERAEGFELLRYSAKNGTKAPASDVVEARRLRDRARKTAARRAAECPVDSADISADTARTSADISADTARTSAPSDDFVFSSLLGSSPASSPLFLADYSKEERLEGQDPRAREGAQKDQPTSMRTRPRTTTADTARTTTADTARTTTADTAADKDRRAQVRDIFEYWVTVRTRRLGLTGPPPRASTERTKKIRARLAEYSVVDIKRAIDGMLSNDFNLDKGFTDIELCCRNSTNLERYRDQAPPPSAPTRTPLDGPILDRGSMAALSLFKPQPSEIEP
jgi:hypothetical protein